MYAKNKKSSAKREDGIAHARHAKFARKMKNMYRFVSFEKRHIS